MGKPLMIPNFAPDELQCLGCDRTPSHDEVAWDIFEQIEVVVCIDCAGDMDELIREGTH